VEWVVHAPKGDVVSLILRHERAGVVRTQINLGEDYNDKRQDKPLIGGSKG